MRTIQIVLMVLALCISTAAGRTSATNSPQVSNGPSNDVSALPDEKHGVVPVVLPEPMLQAQTNSPPSALPATVTNQWEFSVAAMGYLVPHSRDYVQPTLTADRGWLHLEARYNYEDLETGSLWVGYNFSGGNKLSWEFAPMLGGVFGNTTGIAPGYKGSLSWWKLQLYSEGEYVVDTGDSSGNFFYNWSELTLAPVEWFRFGMATQRTRAYQTDRDIQRGFLVGLSHKNVSFTTYVFNPDESKPTFVFAAGLNF